MEDHKCLGSISDTKKTLNEGKDYRLMSSTNMKEFSATDSRIHKTKNKNA